VKNYGTFGPVDWPAYYKKPIVIKGKPIKVDIQADMPCNICFKARNCNYAFGGDKNNCFRFNKWFARWWPVITGQKILGGDNEKV